MVKHGEKGLKRMSKDLFCSNKKTDLERKEEDNLGNNWLKSGQ